MQKISKLQLFSSARTFVAISCCSIAGVISCAPQLHAAGSPKIVSAENLAQGKNIFENSCTRCHDLPNPTAHSAEEWVGIMKDMAPKAKLTKTQHKMVYQYVSSVK